MMLVLRCQLIGDSNTKKFKITHHLKQLFMVKANQTRNQQFQPLKSQG